VLAQRLDAHGKPQWEADIVVSEGSAMARLPAAALDAAGNALVIWIAEQGDSTDLFSQRLDGAGNKQWQRPRQLNQATGLVDGLNAPAVAFDAAGSATVLWVDKRQSSVYLQRFNSTGEPGWTDDHLLVAMPGAGWPTPDLALWPDGGSVVVWQSNDVRGRHVVYAQRFNADGIPQWQAGGTLLQPISTAIRNGGRARVALDGVGQSVIAWQDDRAMNGDVFIQRLDTIGQRLWQADQSVIATDHFFVKEGLVHSTIIDTTDANIARACLTAQVEPHSGSVEFFLSNNDGAIWGAVQPGVTHFFTTAGSALRWRMNLVADLNMLSVSPMIDELRIVYEATESCKYTTYLPLIQH
jgi:hypothetical protein